MSFHASPYFLNVALHTAVLSIFATLILAFLRQARHRSVAAIAGLLAVGFLPWLSALPPAPAKIAAVAEIQTSPLPSWAVVTLPAPAPAEIEKPKPAE